MSPLLAPVCLLFLTAAPDKKPADPLPALLAKLREPVKLTEEPVVVTLQELLDTWSKDHGVRFVVNEQAFKAAGEADVLNSKPGFKARLAGVQLHKALDLVLAQLAYEGIYLVRKDY